MIDPLFRLRAWYAKKFGTPPTCDTNGCDGPAYVATETVSGDVEYHCFDHEPGPTAPVITRTVNWRDYL